MITIHMNEVLAWLVVSLLAIGWCGTWFLAKATYSTPSSRDSQWDAIFGSTMIVALLIAGGAIITGFVRGVS
jgi:hypothetical protein